MEVQNQENMASWSLCNPGVGAVQSPWQYEMMDYFQLYICMLYQDKPERTTYTQSSIASGGGTDAQDSGQPQES